ncbi:MAG: hypothetical protein B7733_08510 [Myxococcales bacterium FL481]|nr:MAG: hypothetical protein B7733_08510 [Myxococcales bacterium FL481]
MARKDDQQREDSAALIWVPYSAAPDIEPSQWQPCKEQHDCFENARHHFDEDSVLSDWYDCAICGEFLQAG